MPDVAPTPRNLFSFSRLKTFHQCPLRYRYRYLKGLKEAFRSIESFLGTVVHDVLQWLYEERDRRSVPPLDVVLDEFARRWRASWSDDVTVIRLSDSGDDAFRTGREMLERFHGDAFQKDRSTTVAKDSRVQSSTIQRTRNRWPSDRASDTKSNDQRWFALSGTRIGLLVPRARLRPPRLRTVNRSSR